VLEHVPRHLFPGPAPRRCPLLASLDTITERERQSATYVMATTTVRIHSTLALAASSSPEDRHEPSDVPAADFDKIHSVTVDDPNRLPSRLADGGRAGWSERLADPLPDQGSERAPRRVDRDDHPSSVAPVAWVELAREETVSRRRKKRTEARAG
jgi:hypothetical protein